MSPIKAFCLMLALAAALSGCAKPPPKQAELTTQSMARPQTVSLSDQPMPAPLVSAAPDIAPGNARYLAANGDNGLVTGSIGGTSLAGRTLRIGSVADLAKLKPGEVILTFDDGPDPAITPKILATLKDYEVKATFFMVGRMARAHPETAQMVAWAGHTIGSHSHGHEHLIALAQEAAIKSVTKADDEIAAAIRPTGKKLAPFFRFPYLEQTRALRASLMDSGFVIFDVDADSWDYLAQSGDRIVARTLRRLDAKGKGIVLFHDIHARTAKLLPDFLDELKARGYRVVRAIPGNQSVFDFATLIAAR